MLKIKEKQLSFYSVLYEKIPENHLLKRIDRAVDFSFINEFLADSYNAFRLMPDLSSICAKIKESVRNEMK